MKGDQNMIFQDLTPNNSIPFICPRPILIYVGALLAAPISIGSNTKGNLLDVGVLPPHPRKGASSEVPKGHKPLSNPRDSGGNPLNTPTPPTGWTLRRLRSWGCAAEGAYEVKSDWIIEKKE